MTVRAGRLDTLITVEQKSVSQESVYGTEQVSWVPFLAESGSPTVAIKFWAEVVDALPSREEYLAERMLPIARNGTRIRFRYHEGIDSSMRITVHGRGPDQIFQIIGGPAIVGGRRQMIEVVCERFST